MNIILLITAIILFLLIIASLISFVMLLAGRNCALQYYLGKRAYKKRKYKNAKSAFEKCLKQKPNFTKAGFMLGMTYFALKEYKNAKKCYEDIIQLEPDYINAIFNAGKSEEAQGNYTDALLYYEKALEKTTADPDIYFHAGQCMFMLGDYEKAEQFLNSAKELSPQRPDALFFINRCKDKRCNYNMEDECGEVLFNYMSLSKFQDFIEDFNLVFAKACAKAGNIKMAIEECKKAYAINSSNPELLALMGLIEIVTAKRGGGSTKNLESAKKHLTKAISLAPNNSEIEFLLSYVKTSE